MPTTFAEWVSQQRSFGSSERDRDEWLVAPVGQSRDSDLVEQSNFAALLKELGGESETCEVLRCGHWAVGWTEIILAHPDHVVRRQPVGAFFDLVGARLKECPLLDDDDHSDREWEACCEFWEGLSLNERIRYCARGKVSIFAARREEMPDFAHGAPDVFRIR